jgi:hypothetical protein
MMNDYNPEPLPIEDIELEGELLALVERLAEHRRTHGRFSG